MKNKAVEDMLRVQFEIDKDIPVVVEFIASINSKYQFKCHWWEENIRCSVDTELPHLNMHCQEIL